MNKSFVAICALLASSVAFVSAAEEKPAERGNSLPLVSELLRASQEKSGQAKVGVAKTPRALAASEIMAEAADILPQGALLFIDIPDGSQLAASAGQSSTAMLLSEKAVARFLKDNPFGIEALFQDLPRAYASPDTVALYGTLADFVSEFIRQPGRISIAFYPGPNGVPVMVMLIDAGTDRTAMHKVLQSQAEGALTHYPQLVYSKAADYGDDYFETLRSDAKEAPIEIVFGLVRNFAVIATDSASLTAFAAKAQASEPLSATPACRGMGAKTSAQGQLRAFLDLGAVIVNFGGPALAASVPGNSLLMAAQAPVIYYDMRFAEGMVGENFTLAAPKDAKNGVVQSLAGVMDEFQSDSLKTPGVFPYQASDFIGIKVRPRILAESFPKELEKGSASPYSILPSDAREPLAFILNKLGGKEGRIDALMEGEIGFATIENGKDAQRAAVTDWLMAIVLRDAKSAEDALTGEGVESRALAGFQVFTRGSAKNMKQPAWVVLPLSSFSNLGQSMLVAASSGEFIDRFITSTIGGKAPLSANEDFKAQMARFPGKGNLVYYRNVKQDVQAEYGDLQAYILSFFPQIKSINSRPPLAVVAKHFSGSFEAISFSDDGDLRISSFASFGQAPLAAGKLLLGIPYWLRQREERALTEARQNLGRINLELQLYATKFGHYPPSLAALLAEFKPQVRDSLLADPAAVLRIGKEEALNRGYTYVGGLTTSDEPGSVILYSTESWYYHYRYADMTGYSPCRLVLTIDGKITPYWEEDFKMKILPRLKGME